MNSCFWEAAFNWPALQNTLESEKGNASTKAPRGPPVIGLPGTCRVLEERIDILEGKLAEETRLRLSAEKGLAEEQERRHQAESSLRNAQSNSHATNAAVIQSLRSELRSQEAEIAEAQKIKSRVRYIFS